jgi:hypothetical protein
MVLHVFKNEERQNPKDYFETENQRKTPKWNIKFRIRTTY